MYILVVDIVTSKSGIPCIRKSPEKFNKNQINITLPSIKIVFSENKSPNCLDILQFLPLENNFVEMCSVDFAIVKYLRIM